MKSPQINPLANTSLASATTVYVVRHADKAASGTDPGLSSKGKKRAQLLAYLLSEDKVDAVFVTATNRSRQTGSPTATQSGVALTEYADEASLATSISSNQAGKRVLVVTHSNTLKPIARRLAGAPAMPEQALEESQFDRLYVVHINGLIGNLDRLRYGAMTP
jgi:broad specificity phosphatase PhoE